MTKRYMILLAEDETYIRLAYQINFERVGYKVITAQDGVEAIELARLHKPDLILLDLIMPRKNGLEALAELKKDPQTKMIPIVALTNLSQTTDEKEVRRLGAADFIIKSNHSMKSVLARIEKYLPR